ncbi:ECF RNA polymerase sigma factor SigK [Candidatus Thermoflexus japonica]|uniref:ECF RNA polymerase sigma factor SigK n=1 Tax=Candidatus Thermoflexus japonica TaxID=2035417 RepID=A0A2H5Y9W9_9CHLR|nr:ECF RNA polymerase sigma factor SigK [Candidatus Thermoflexus japonica]
MREPGYTDLDDAALLARIAGGDEQALAALYDRHGARAFSLALRILGDPETAEEVVLDVFWSVWQHAGTFMPERGRFTTWLYAMVRHRAIDQLRRRRARPSQAHEIEPESMEAAAADPTVEALAEAEELARAVREAMAALPEAQRQVLELAYFRGWSHREIAEYLGEPLGTVKSRLHLALRKLHDWLAQRGLLPG